MIIGRHDLNQKILIIAEIGNNHEGSLSRAVEMVETAAACGADVVKFQTIVPERLVSGDQSDRLAQLRRLCLSYEDFTTLAKVATQAGVMFMSTPFDLESADFLESLVPAYKVASGDNTFYPLMAHLCIKNKPLLISTGLLDYAGCQRLRDFIATQLQASDGQLSEQLSEQLALLHCVVNYPTRAEDAQLRSIQALAPLGVTVGYSDHTLGITAALGAAALGARIIEKHFTLDKQLSDFRDHQLSADPHDLRELVSRVRELEQMLGRPEKFQAASEAPMDAAVRRSIATARALPAGHLLQSQDLIWVRPGTGIPAGQEDIFINRRLRQAVAAGELLRPESLEEA